MTGFTTCSYTGRLALYTTRLHLRTLELSRVYRRTLMTGTAMKENMLATARTRTPMVRQLFCTEIYLIYYQAEDFYQNDYPDERSDDSASDEYRQSDGEGSYIEDPTEYCVLFHTSLHDAFRLMNQFSDI